MPVRLVRSGGGDETAELVVSSVDIEAKTPIIFDRMRSGLSKRMGKPSGSLMNTLE